MYVVEKYVPTNHTQVQKRRHFLKSNADRGAQLRCIENFAMHLSE